MACWMDEGLFGRRRLLCTMYNTACACERVRQWESETVREGGGTGAVRLAWNGGRNFCQLLSGLAEAPAG